jgi:hydroxymethylpyrimidine pyrophosphatase-like HAD family hydrolase
VRRLIVAVDLDGTLLRSDRTVSERTREALRDVRAAGAEIVLATARSPRGTIPIAEDLRFGGLAICANGATLFDLDTRTIVRHRPLATATAHRLVVALREAVPGIVFGWELELRFGSEPAYESLREPRWWPRPDDAFPPSDPLAWEQPMTKLIGRVPGADLHEVLTVARRIAGDDAAATLAGEAFVELLAPGVGKDTALAELATLRGLGSEAVVAFGDHVTDAPMLEWAGLGVAVANAHPVALAAADEVTLSNDEDGVALVLERLARPGQPRR